MDPSQVTFQYCMRKGLRLILWHWGGGLVLGTSVKSSVHFILSPVEGLSSHWAAWDWGRGARDEVKLSFLPSSMHLTSALPGCSKCHLKSLALVKVFWHVDIPSNWYFCEGAVIGNLLKSESQTICFKIFNFQLSIACI